MSLKLTYRPFELRLANPWKIASSTGSSTHRVVIVELQDANGVIGRGEGAPSSLYGETVETASRFFQQVDPRHLSFADIAGSMRYLDGLQPRQQAAICALNIALLDGAAKLAG